MAPGVLAHHKLSQLVHRITIFLYTNTVCHGDIFGHPKFWLPPPPLWVESASIENESNFQGDLIFYGGCIMPLKPGHLFDYLDSTHRGEGGYQNLGWPNMSL